MQQQLETVQQPIEAILAEAQALNSHPTALLIRANSITVKARSSEGTVAGAILRDMGFENLADGNSALCESISMETVLVEDPDYIFVVLQSADPKDAQEVLETTLLNNPAWQSLTAVQEGRYYVMDPNLYNLKPNGRWGEAYEKLADILYPQG